WANIYSGGRNLPCCGGWNRLPSNLPPTRSDRADREEVVNRLCLRVLAALALASLPTGAAVRAQDYPARPIRLIVSFPAGSSDVLGRAFAQHAALGQPVVVANVAGANGSIGTGSTGHLLGEMLRRTAGIDIVHVPYKGAAPGVTALLAGDVQFLFFPVFVDARALVRSGALRPLALVDSRRSPVAPDLPTLPELGYPLEAAAWFALIAPAGTPEAIVQRLAREVRRVLSLEAMRRFLDDHGIEAGDLGPEALKAYIASEHARYGRMVRETGVQVE